jgi:hypothetical protein
LLISKGDIPVRSASSITSSNSLILIFTPQ